MTTDESVACGESESEAAEVGIRRTLRAAWRRSFLGCGLAAGLALTSGAAAAGTTLAYWPFGESGLNDASGNGCTLEGGATITDHATLGGSASTVLNTVGKLDLSAYEDVTVEYFIKVKDHVGTASILEHSASMNDNAGGFQALLNDRDIGDQRLSILLNLGSTAAMPYACIDTSMGPLQDGVWHHVALVIKSKSSTPYSHSAVSNYVVSLYVDGAIFAYAGKRSVLTGNCGPLVGSLRNDKLFIGSRNNASLFLTGELDDIRVSAGALTPGEFLKTRTGRAAQTIAYYPFGTNGLSDASGNGNHLHASETGVSLGDDGAAVLSGETGQFLQTYKPLDLRSYTDGLTFECFFKTTQSDKRPLLVHAPATLLTRVERPFCAFVYNTEIRAFTRNGINGTKIDNMSSGKNVNDGQWHHFAYVYNPADAVSTTRLYVDGAEATTVGNEAFQGFQNGFLSLGRDVTVGWPGDYDFLVSAGPFAGEIDDVRITDAPLSAEDFLSARTTQAGTVENPPTYAPVTLSHWKFSRSSVLKDETGLNPLELSNTNAVEFEDGAATFSGLGSLNAILPPDWRVYDKLTVEFYVNYPKLREGDVNFEMNFLQTGDVFQEYAGILRIASDAGYMSSAARAGALLITYGGKVAKYKGDMFASPHYGDGAWHHWVYRYDRSSGTLATDLTIDGVKVPADASAFMDTTPVALRSDRILYLGGRGNVAPNTTWMTANNLYGRMDDIRISAGWLTTDQQLSERSAEAADAPQTIVRWNFDSDTPQVDTSGVYSLVAQDYSTATFADGMLVFNGVSGVKVNQTLSFAGMEAVTVETVFRADAPYETTELLFELGEAFTTFGSTQFFAWLTEGGAVQAGLYNNHRSIPGRFIRKGEWNHLALVIDMATSDLERQVTLYVNGEKATDGVWTASISTLRDNQRIFLGSRKVTYPFTGAMANFAVTEGALKPGTFALARPSPADAETGVIAYWPFDNRSPGADRSGHGHSFSSAGLVSSGDGSLKLTGTGVATRYLPFNSATNGLTVECFVRVDPAAAEASATLFKTTEGVLTNSTGALGVELAGGNLVSRWESGMFADTTNVVWRRENADTSAGSSVSVADGAWHHVAVVVNPAVAGLGRSVLFVDGVEMPYVADADGDRDQAFVNGILTVGDGFVGEIDDLRVTARALAPAAFLKERTPAKGLIVIFR